MPILSFEDDVTESFFHDGKIKKGNAWAGVKEVATRKLDMLNYATQLGDLKSPPGNHLEALSGDLNGFHSIRINAQWRVVFKWTAFGPTEVRICDYH